MLKVVVDLLGADAGEETLVAGAVKAALEGGFGLVLVGNEEKIKKELGSYDGSRISVLDASFTVDNTQPPTAILSDKGLSSVSIAYAALKDDDDAVALVSAGNTGAILVGGIYKLGLVEGIKRPCLASLLPTARGKNVVLLDCGANLDCKSETLLSFARLGAALAVTDGVKNPKVALLSVGKEDKKGNLITKETFGLIAQSGLNFMGNVEGYDVLGGEADVIVCDGFYGNVVLKNCEAVGKLALSMLKGKLEVNGKTPAGFSEAYAEVYKNFDYNSQGGAILLGVNKAVVKAHGAADSETMYSCVKQAYRLGKGNLAGAIKKLI